MVLRFALGGSLFFVPVVLFLFFFHTHPLVLFCIDEMMFLCIDL